MSDPSLNDVLILVYTCRAHAEKAHVVARTWAKDFPHALFVTDDDDPALRDRIVIPETGRERLSQKTILMWREVHARFGARYRWFVKVDDDCVLWSAALADVLAGFDASKPWYLGNTRHNPGSRSEGWAAGFTYALSRPALDLLVGSSCADLTAFSWTHKEDVAVGRALSACGVGATDVDRFSVTLFDPLFRAGRTASVSGFSPRSLRGTAALRNAPAALKAFTGLLRFKRRVWSWFGKGY